MLERSQEERAELASFRVSRLEVILFQKSGKECLGQVLGIVRGVSHPPHEGVERIPVGPAQGFQGLLGVWRGRLPGSHHHAPAGSSETLSITWVEVVDRHQWGL